MNEKEIKEAEKLIETPAAEENVDDPIEPAFPERELENE